MEMVKMIDALKATESYLRDSNTEEWCKKICCH